MAVRFKGETSHVGEVLYIYEHMWLDGMLEVNAVVWDKEKHSTEHIQIGYYGADGCNLAGGSAEPDADKETVRDVLRTLKVDAREAYAKSVTDYMREIRAGRTARVVRGRKVKIGTDLSVFWVGDRPTWRSKQYDWMNETERIAGCYDMDGNKVWIKAEYLEATDKIKAPNAKERKKYIKDFVRRRAADLHIKVRA